MLFFGPGADPVGENLTGLFFGTFRFGIHKNSSKNVISWTWCRPGWREAYRCFPSDLQVRNSLKFLEECFSAGSFHTRSILQEFIANIRPRGQKKHFYGVRVNGVCKRSEKLTFSEEFFVIWFLGLPKKVSSLVSPTWLHQKSQKLQKRRKKKKKMISQVHLY